MDIAGYIRVSTEQQKQEGSHENQRDQLKEWAERNDHTITFYEDIAISGQSDEREDYQRLIGDQTAGEIGEATEYDAVAVRELSRFGRSLKRVLNDLDHLKGHEVDFISVKDNFDTTTAQGKLLLQVIGAFNEFWANLARERAIENVEKRRENGEPVGRPKKLTDVQLQQVFEWRQQGHSYGQIKVLVENMERFNVESIDRSTISRYCTDADVEVAEN